MKQHKEVLKTIALTALVAAVIAFVAGYQFARSQQAEITSAVKAAQQVK